MPDRILSGSASAAVAALLILVGAGAAQAARCPLGEIYRPSLGVCVAKEKAIQAGIYHGPSHRRAASELRPVEQADAAPVEKPESVRTATADPAPIPKSRPQALAAIERRAPASRTGGEGALAFTTSSKPRADEGRSLIQPRPVQATAISYTRSEPSPFGSLVALEPVP